jgi:hypothetical protein
VAATVSAFHGLYIAIVNTPSSLAADLIKEVRHLAALVRAFLLQGLSASGPFPCLGSMLTTASALPRRTR